MSEPGTLAYSAGGTLQVRVGAGRYRLTPEEVKRLLFFGWTVPITEVRTATCADGHAISETTIAGHATVNEYGMAVLFHTRAGSFIVPLSIFRRVARGNAVSAPLFPLLSEAEE